MNIVDRLMLGQNRFLAIAEICNKYYLLSITEKNISILKELEDFQPLPQELESSLNFSKILHKYKKGSNNDKEV